MLCRMMVQAAMRRWIHSHYTPILFFTSIVDCDSVALQKTRRHLYVYTNATAIRFTVAFSATPTFRYMGAKNTAIRRFFPLKSSKLGHPRVPSSAPSLPSWCRPWAMGWPVPAQQQEPCPRPALPALRGVALPRRTSSATRPRPFSNAPRCQNRRRFRMITVTGQRNEQVSYYVPSSHVAVRIFVLFTLAL